MNKSELWVENQIPCWNFRCCHPGPSQIHSLDGLVLLVLLLLCHAALWQKWDRNSTFKCLKHLRQKNTAIFIHIKKINVFLHFREQKGIYRGKKLVYFNCIQEVRDHKNTIKSTLWGSLSAFPQQRPDCLCWKPALMWYSYASLDHMAVKSWGVRKSWEKPLWRPPCLTWEQFLSSICRPQQRYMVCPSQTCFDLESALWPVWQPLGFWLTPVPPGDSSAHLAPAQGSVGPLLQLAQLVAFLPLQSSLLQLQSLLQWSLCCPQDLTWTYESIHLPDTKILE